MEPFLEQMISESNNGTEIYILTGSQEAKDYAENYVIRSPDEKPTVDAPYNPEGVRDRVHELLDNHYHLSPVFLESLESSLQTNVFLNQLKNNKRIPLTTNDSAQGIDLTEREKKNYPALLADMYKKVTTMSKNDCEHFLRLNNLSFGADCLQDSVSVFDKVGGKKINLSFPSEYRGYGDIRHNPREQLLNSIETAINKAQSLSPDKDISKQISASVASCAKAKALMEKALETKAKTVQDKYENIDNNYHATSIKYQNSVNRRNSLPSVLKWLMPEWRINGYRDKYTLACAEKQKLDELRVKGDLPLGEDFDDKVSITDRLSAEKKAKTFFGLSAPDIIGEQRVKLSNVDKHFKDAFVKENAPLSVDIKGEVKTKVSELEK